MLDVVKLTEGAVQDLLRTWGIVSVLFFCSSNASAGDDIPLDFLRDDKRPGVQGCEGALVSYDPVLRYIADDESNIRVSRADPADRTQHSTFETRLIEAIAAAAEWKRSHGRKPTFNVLALSGGGQWGAYGAGFLNGWAEADGKLATPSEDFIRREDVDLITGISTGSMQVTFAYLGSSADPAVRAQAAKDLEAEFLDPTIGELVKDHTVDLVGGLIGIGSANSLYDVGELVKRVQGRIGNDMHRYQAMPQRQRLYSGAVNLDDGLFTIADLKFLSDRPEPAMSPTTKRSCFASSILASAAVPLGFPPRFIGGKMYVDGGARFALFSSIIFNNERIRKALRDAKLSLAVRVVINGNQSSSSYADEGQKPVENGFLQIAKATMANVLDQLYKDSAFRNEQDLVRAFPGQYTSAYTYVPNKDIRDSNLEACKGFAQKPAEGEFDPKFMKCLYEIGRSRWNTADTKKAWKEFKDIPVH